MSIERTQIENISNNLIQVFKIGNYRMTLEYLTNIKRWVVSIDGVVNNRLLAPNTDILSEYNLGFYLFCECDDDLGAYESTSFLSTGNSRLYILREV